MMSRSEGVASLALCLALASGSLGCAFLGGAAVGAGATGAAYEHRYQRELDQLDEDYRSGRIDRDEYHARRRAIENGSVLH